MCVSLRLYMYIYMYINMCIYTYSFFRYIHIYRVQTIDCIENYPSDNCSLDVFPLDDCPPPGRLSLRTITPEKPCTLDNCPLGDCPPDDCPLMIAPR